MQRRRRARIAITASFTTLALAYLTATRFISPAPSFGETVAALSAMLAIALPAYITWPARKEATSTPEVLTQAADRLATTLTRQWSAEALARGLTDPEPLDVPWRTTRAPIAALPAEVLNQPNMPALGFAGTVTDLALTWTKLPYRQLVITGAPGAGKTSAAVIALQKLLADRAPGGPVPVLLNLASWQPTTTSLTDWMAATIRRSHPWITDTSTYGPDTPEQLITQGSLIPVLDGLDELPTSEHQAAITQLHATLAAHNPYLLTCRSNEYTAMIEARKRPLPRVAVIELQPVEPETVIRYLASGHPHGLRHWTDIAAHLKAHPCGPLASVLANPLMAYLIRATHPHGTNASELLQHRDAASIENNLLDSYITTIYSTPTEDPSANTPTPAQALAWLTILAKYIHSTGSNTLAWWELAPRTHTFLRHTLNLRSTWLHFPISSKPPEVWPGRWPHRRRQLTYATIRSLGTWVAFTLLGALADLPYLSLSSIPLALWHFYVGTRPDLLYPEPTELADPIGAYQEDRLATRKSNTSASLWVSVFLGLIAQLLVALGTSPVIADPASQPQRSKEVMALLATAFTGATVIGALIAGMFFSVLMTPFIHASAALRLTTRRLSWCGIAPLDLMAFLDDAHRRGVLRQVGAEYQFRHQLLATRLASTPWTPPIHRSCIHAALKTLKQRLRHTAQTTRQP